MVFIAIRIVGLVCCRKAVLVEDHIIVHITSTHFRLSRDSYTKQEELLRALAEQVGAETPVEDWPGVLELAGASVCVDKQRIADLIYVMEQTEEPRH